MEQSCITLLYLAAVLVNLLTTASITGYYAANERLSIYILFIAVMCPVIYVNTICRPNICNLVIITVVGSCRMSSITGVLIVDEAIKS